MMSKKEIQEELKKQLIIYLNLEDYTPDMIGDDENLFGDGLALDSIDALELTVLLEREFNVKIKDANEGRKVLASINSMADFILANNK